MENDSFPRAGKFLEQVDSSAEAYALFSLLQQPGVGIKKVLELKKRFETFTSAVRETNCRQSPEAWQKHLEENPNFICISSSRYPHLLRESYPVPFIYYRGNAELLFSTAKPLAIVGSRKLTTYNQAALKKIFSRLPDRSLAIISGLAYGIDTLAHRLALDNHVPTIAVLGSSVQTKEVYPRGNSQLAEEIVASGGLLVSPFPTGTTIEPTNFPRRNELIAGLAQTLLVVSAAERSGALITARLALDANRDICCIPGSILDPLAVGTNRLLAQGAHCITSSDDLKELLHLPSTEQKQKVRSTLPQEQKILDLITEKPWTIEDLSYETGMPIFRLSILLTEMEMKSLIRRENQHIYIL